MIYTSREAAEKLGIAEVTARRYMENGRLKWRYATPKEIATLLTGNRVKAIPVQGLRVIEESALSDFGTDRRTSKGSGRKPYKTP